MTTGRTTSAVLTALALAAGGAVSLAGSASAAPGGDLLYGLTDTDRLVKFRAETPGVIIDDDVISGLPAGTDVVGIDVRPATGELFALVRTTATGVGQLYVVDEVTGAATARGAAITPTLEGSRFGVDFNPQVDRVRIVSDTEQNLRINPDTGGASARTPANSAVPTDGPLQYAAGDAGAGTVPDVVAAGYLNNVAGTTNAVLFGIDLARGTLVRLDPPNAGTLNTVGTGLGVVGLTDAGLDVSAGGTAYAALTTSASGFYSVNLETGAATLRGTFGTAASPLRVQDITVASARFTASAGAVTEGAGTTVTVTRTGDVADAATVAYSVGGGTATSGADYTATSGTLSFGANERARVFTIPTLQDDFTEGRETVVVTLSGASVGNAGRSTTVVIADDEAGLAYGLTTTNEIIRFSINSPGTVTSSSAVTGLNVGDDLVGIDVRPANGLLYAVGRNAVAGSSALYRLDTPTGNGPVAATRVGPIAPGLTGTSFGVDFNPVVDRLRIVSNTGENLAVHPDTAATTQQTLLNYPSTDPGATVVPVVTGAGYTTSPRATPTATVLYGIETNRDTLVTQNPPASGTLNTVGSLGIGNVNLNSGLDIAASGNAAFALLSTTGTPATATQPAVADTPNRFYRINLTTGAATALTDGTPGNPDPAATLEAFALVSTAASATPAPAPTAAPTATPTATTRPTASPTVTVTPSQPAARKLTIVVRKSVFKPGIVARVTVTGTAGSAIELRAYSRPSTTYKVVRRGIVGANGTIVFDVTPGTNTRLFAVVTGFPATASGSAVIDVQTALSLTVVRKGARSYTFQGRILPRRAGQLITLYRVVNGRRVIAAQIKTDSTGTYRIERRFTGSGTFAFLTRTGQNLTNAAGESDDGRARPTSIH